MPIKRLLCPARVRRGPWYGNHYVESCAAYALALYLFLVTVAGDRGLSYYSDATLSVRLSMDGATLNKAHQALTRVQLIAYERPLYQVVGLSPPDHLSERPGGELRSIQALPAQALGKTL